MIDNFEKIKSLLNFTEGDFYFVQIIQRKKEHPELGKNNKIIKTYYIRSLEQLERDYKEMVMLANFHNARVQINLNKRNFEKLSFHMLKAIVDKISNKSFDTIARTFNSVAGKYSSEVEKKWLLDIDFVDATLEEVEKALNFTVAYKIYSRIPTKNGVHLITTPFNSSTFLTFCNKQNIKVSIHRDNPTILYVP